MRRSSAVVLVLLLSGCGGGGGGSSHAAVPTVPQSGPKGSGNVQFSITIAAPKTAQSKNRSPKFVSPATKSVSVTVAGTTTNIDVVSGSPGCNTDYTQPAFFETAVNLEPRGMLRGPDGNIWFVEDSGASVGTIAPGNVYTDHSAAGQFQNGIILGPDGAFWTTNPFYDTIGRMTTNGSYTDFGGFPFDMQYLAEANDHTVWGTAYTSGPSNTVYHIAADGSFLAGDTITTRAGTSTRWPALGPDGAIYVTEFDGTNGWVARIAKNGATWSLTNEFPLPGQPIPITAGPDNALWTVDANGKLYRMTTSGTVTSTYTLAGSAEDIITGSDGALWVAEYGSNKIGRITTSGTINEFTVPTANSLPYAVAFGSDGVYFTERNANQVGRINFPVACTATASVPAGGAGATVIAYDAIGGAAGSGNKLSVQTLPVSIVANTTNTINVVLNGIVKSLAVSAATGYNSCNSSGTIALSLQAIDASGNAIIGPGNYSDAAGNALTITLTTSDTSSQSSIANGAITRPGATPAPALNWSGGFLNSQTVSATVSGGTITGTTTPAGIQGGCS
jgi:virginiamycin B lyase